MIAGSRQPSFATMFLAPGVIGSVFAGLTGEWILLPAILLLWTAWVQLRTEEGPPVLAMAFSYQWTQVFIGFFYYPLTGRLSRSFHFDDPTPMGVIALGCLISLLVGLTTGLRVAAPTQSLAKTRPQYFWSETASLIGYLAFVAVAGLITFLADSLWDVAQFLLALIFVRFALLYLLLRRYAAERRWGAFFGVGAIEVLSGFTSYFAGFREGFMLMFLAALEKVDYRKRSHWAIICSIACTTVAAGVFWTAVKGQVRSEIDAAETQSSRLQRLQRVSELAAASTDNIGQNFSENLDRLVDRQWVIYYPSLTLKRVPEWIPHSEGEFLWRAMTHVVTPRFLFPDKPDLMLDSDKVRVYTGVWVAGLEQNTSIAFGYVAESYVDFGFPWMFLPILAYGFVMGLAYRLINRLIWHRDLAIAATTVIFWLNLYLFERSWDRMLGVGLTVMIVLTGSCWFVEQFAKREK